MTIELQSRIIQTLLVSGGLNTPDIKDRAILESVQIPRSIADTALVTRIAPSPTGFVHIGTIYAALLCERLAHQSGGVYYVRIEDTDKKREVVGAQQRIIDGLSSFGLTPDEGPGIGGNYGPYLQSDRRDIYLSYAIELLKQGRAYPCFATSDDLTENVTAQQKAKLRPGYYGSWAIWRQKSDKDIEDALNAGKPFILRFKSDGSHVKRIEFDDSIKGRCSLPQNDLDVPLIKGDGTLLPTYHLAHVVDDHLMQTKIILRGDEWLPSTPLHIELATALGIKPFTYAHIAPISIFDKNGGGKRKLSKRKDPEADIEYFFETGYPIVPLKKYLCGLASSDFEQWSLDNPNASVEEFEVTFAKLSKSRSPLYDEQKLADYSKNYIASLSLEDYVQNAFEWLRAYGKAYALTHNYDASIIDDFLAEDIGVAKQYFAIEHGGEKARKDVAKWSDILEEYGYFVDSIFDKEFSPRIADQLKQFDPKVVSKLCSEYIKTYDPSDDQLAWFEKLKVVAEKSGFALDNKAFRENPSLYAGNVADAAKIIRVTLTGKNRTPDLSAMMRVMGKEKVKNRLTE